MNGSSALVVLVVVAALLMVAVVVLWVRYSRLQARFSERVQEEFSAWRNRELEAARKELRQAAQDEAKLDLDRWRGESEARSRADAIKRSSAIVSGKATEHLAPYIGSFPYNPRDARFLGTPVDLLVFDGMSEDALREIVFLEIKSGSSSLTTRERRVRDAVLEGHVTWREFRLGGGE